MTLRNALEGLGLLTSAKLRRRPRRESSVQQKRGMTCHYYNILARFGLDILGNTTGIILLYNLVLSLALLL